MLYHDERPDISKHLDDEGISGAKIRKLAFVAGVLILSVFGGLSWYAYKEGKGSTVPGNAPLVKAPAESFREKPENPGGMDIPHRDKTIYEAIDDRAGKGGLPKVEALLPGPEEPVQVTSTDKTLAERRMEVFRKKDEQPVRVEKMLDADAAAKARQQHAPDELKAVMNALKPAIATDAGEGGVPSVSVGAAAARPRGEEDTRPAPVEALGEHAKPAVTPPAAPERKPAAPLPAASMVKTTTPEEGRADPGYRIQLGAFRSREDALDSWNKAAGRYQSLLNGKSYVVERADLGAKGLFFRLQAVPMRSQAEARELCDKLSAQKQGCFVVKR